MSRLTFVIEFEDGKEPLVHAHMEAFGGEVVAVSFTDALAERKKELERILAAPPAVPAGWKLVPVEMTDEIGEAIAMEARCCGGIALDIYDAALRAAPVITDSGGLITDNEASNV